MTSFLTGRVARGLATGFVVVGLIACGGCGDDGKKTGDSGNGGGEVVGVKDPPKTGGGTYDAATSKGMVSGTVKYTGSKGQRIPLNVASDEFCKGAWAGNQLFDEKFWVNDDKTAPNVFVWAKKGPHKGMKGFAVPKGFVVTQKDCRYAPHVFGVMTGQEFTVENPDQTSHNVNIKASRNAASNFAQASGAKDKVIFSKKEKAIPFACDVHSWMSAHCWVLDHPFFATTDDKGNYSIGGLPDGEYEFGAWHEWFGETSFKVTVSGGAVTHDVTLE